MRRLSDGAPAGGATDWSEYDVPAIWSMVEDFDTGPQWRHVTGWRKASQLTELHLKHMRKYRDWLAATWPPERNEASRVYLAEFDRLMASVQATYDAAVANHATMSAATHAINEARDTLRAIHDRWQANASVMADFETRVAASSSGVPAPMPGPPPLAPNWRDELNDRARRAMNLASGEIALASLLIVTPPDYISPTAASATVSSQDVTDVGARLVPPAIPPVAARPASRTAPPVSHRPGHLIVAGGPASRVDPGTDPAPHDALPSTGIIGPVGIAPLPGAPRPGRVPVGPPGVPPAEQRVGVVRPKVSGADGTSGPRPVRPLPPGGVIGGSTAIGAPVISNSPGQRINPVGGVIGGGAINNQPGTDRRSTVPRAVTGHGRVADNAYRSPDGHLITISGGRPLAEGRPGVSGWDREDPWKTEQGARPIIEPPPPRHHNPGPAIGM